MKDKRAGSWCSASISACVYCFEHNLCQSHTHSPNPIQYKRMHTQTRAHCQHTHTINSGLFLSLSRAFSLTILCCLFGLPSACKHYTRCESMLGVCVCVCVSMMRKTYTPRYLYAHSYDLSMSVYVWRKITILALLVPISKIYTDTHTIFTCICFSGLSRFERYIYAKICSRDQGRHWGREGQGEYFQVFFLKLFQVVFFCKF